MAVARGVARSSTMNIRTVFGVTIAPSILVLGAISGAACSRQKVTPDRTDSPAIVPDTRAPAVAPEVRRDESSRREMPQDPLKEAVTEMKQVLTELAALNGKPIETLNAPEAREQPTPADAVMEVRRKNGKSTDPEAISKVSDRKIPSVNGQIPIRIYTPNGGRAPRPVVVYYHGGGFVIGSNDVYDATPRALANAADAVVVSVEYRKAPEHKFPSAHDDAFAAYQWVVKNASALGGSAERIAVAGESAGGNLAANVAILARDKKIKLPVHELLIYPVASSNFDSPSYQEWQNAKPLNKAMMLWFTEQYFRTPADAKDPRINLLAANLNGLPTTTIISAEIDPLLSDGQALATQLKEAGVPVRQKTYSGVTHEFFGMGTVVSEARSAVEFAAKRLKDSFESNEAHSRL
jgi:acetyl esterase